MSGFGIFPMPVFPKRTCTHEGVHIMWKEGTNDTHSLNTYVYRYAHGGTQVCVHTETCEV